MSSQQDKLRQLLQKVGKADSRRRGGRRAGGRGGRRSPHGGHSGSSSPRSPNPRSNTVRVVRIVDRRKKTDEGGESPSPGDPTVADFTLLQPSATLRGVSRSPGSGSGSPSSLPPSPSGSPVKGSSAADPDNIRIVHVRRRSARIRGSPSAARVLQNERDLFSAVEQNDLRGLKKLISRKKVNPNACRNQDTYPILIASERGHLNILKYLLLECGATLGVKNGLGWTAIHFAAYHVRLDCLQFLLEFLRDVGEEVGRLSVNDQNGYTGFTALHECCAEKGKVEAVKMLVDVGGADIAIRALTGETPEDVAFANRNVEVLSYLVRKKTEIQFERKVEEWSTLKVEYKRHIQQLADELRVVQEQTKKAKAPQVVKLINSLESLKAENASLTEENAKLKHLIDENSDASFAFGFQRLKETFKSVVDLQAEYARRSTFENKPASEVLDPMLATWKPQLRELVSELDLKLAELQNHEQEFQKLKADSLGYLDTVFYFNQRKLDAEKLFEELRGSHKQIHEEYHRRSRALRRKKLEFELRQLGEEEEEEGEDPDEKGGEGESDSDGDDDVAAFARFSRMQQKEEEVIRALQDESRDLFRELWRLRDCHYPKKRFVEMMRARLQRDLKVDPCILECDEILPLIRGGSMMKEYVAGKFVEVSDGVFKAALRAHPDESVLVRVMPLQKFIRDRENYFEVLRLQEYCNIMKIDRVFLHRTKLGKKEVGVEMQLVEHSLKDWLDWNAHQFSDSRLVKELFKQILDTIVALHRKRNIALQHLDWVSVKLPTLHEARIDVVDNFVTEASGEQKKSNVKCFGVMLYEVLVRRLRPHEQIDLAQLPSYLSDIEKSFLSRLIRDGEIDDAMYDEFFIGKKADMDSLDVQKVEMTISSLLRGKEDDSSQAMEWSMDYSIIQLLTELDRLHTLDELVRPLILNGVPDSIAFEKFLLELFAPRCRIVETKNSNSLTWLPTDSRTYPSLWHSLGKLVLKCMLQKMQLTQLTKLHPFCFYFLNHHHDPSLLTLDQLCQYGRLYDPEFVSSLQALFQCEDPRKLVLFTSGGYLVDSPELVREYVREEIWGMLIGRRGHRMRNLMEFKKGFYQLLQVQKEKNLVRCLTVREMIFLASRDETETNWESTIRQMTLLDVDGKEAWIDWLKAEQKRQSILYYKSLELIKDRRKHREKIRLIGSLLENRRSAGNLFEVLLAWDSMLNLHYKKALDEAPSTENHEQFVTFVVENHGYLAKRASADVVQKCQAKPLSLAEFNFEMWILLRLLVETRLDRTLPRGRTAFFRQFLDRAFFIPNYDDISNVVVHSVLANDRSHVSEKGEPPIAELNEALNKKLALFNRSGVSIRHFNIPPKFQLAGVELPYSEIIECFRSVEEKSGVLSKGSLFYQGANVLLPKILSALADGTGGKVSALGSDDQVPVFIYSVVMANVPDFYAHVVFCDQFYYDGEGCRGVEFGFTVALSACQNIRDSLEWSSMKKRAEAMEHRLQSQRDIDDLNL